MPPSNPGETGAALAAAVNARDLQAALALWTPDAAIVTSTGDLLSGRERIAELLESLIGNHTTVEVQLTGLYVAGDTALATALLTMSGHARRRPFREQSNSTAVYRRESDGVWRIALDAPWGLPALTLHGTS